MARRLLQRPALGVQLPSPGCSWPACPLMLLCPQVFSIQQPSSPGPANPGSGSNPTRAVWGPTALHSVSAGPPQWPAPRGLHRAMPAPSLPGLRPRSQTLFSRRPRDCPPTSFASQSKQRCLNGRPPSLPVQNGLSFAPGLLGLLHCSSPYLLLPTCLDGSHVFTCLSS